MNLIPRKKLPDPDPRDPFAVPEEPLAETVQRATQEVSVRGWPGHSPRDEANALTLYVFRNTFIEALHAGGRITDHEMKKYNIQASAKPAHILYLRDWLRRAFPTRWYALLESRFLPFQKANPWERVALDWEIPADTCNAPAVGSSRAECGASVRGAGGRRRALRRRRGDVRRLVHPQRLGAVARRVTPRRRAPLQYQQGALAPSDVPERRSAGRVQNAEADSRVGR